MRRHLVALYAGRFTGNWGLRFAYAFLPAISRGSGLSLDTLGVLLGLRELMGVTAPAFARPVDRGRQRTGMQVALVAMAGGMAVSVAGGAVGFAVGSVAFGAAKYLFDTAGNAWIGHHVPLLRRGRVIGVIETSWAGAFLVGVPITALLIDTLGWRAPFLAVGALSLALVPLILTSFPPDRPEAADGHHVAPSSLAVRAFYLVAVLISGGPQLVFAAYGTWLEQSLGLSVGAVGLATVLFGLAELGGSSGVALFADRLGGRRAIAVGGILLVPALALTGPADGSLATTLVVLAACFCTFEFALVSTLSVATELRPELRAAGIGGTYAALTVGRAAGTTVGIFLYTAAGIAVTGLVAAAVVVVALAGLVALRGRR